MNYKRLGDYIEPCNEKNIGNKIKLLQGISNRKYFQKAKTNTIGVDLSKYRIVRTGQFAFNRATTRNGDRISIALRFKEDCIVSPSYRIFKSRDENILNSEYLMMWFKRPEFDRYARFRSHGSAHEFFDYDEICDVTLPIPSIEKQQQIVAEYNTVTNRIQLNEKINTNLEATAQALYKHWFVDFEFPNAEGKPYKSSGGKLVYNEELDNEIPVGFEYVSVGNLVKTQYGYTASASFEDVGPKLLRITDITNDFIEWSNVPHCNISKKEYEKYKLNNGDILIARTGATSGYAKRIHKKFPNCVFASFLVRFTPIYNEYSMFLGLTIDNPLFKEFILTNAGGSAQPQANVPLLTSYQILKPNKTTVNNFNDNIEIILDTKEQNQIENQTLKELQRLLLAKMTQVETNTVEV